MTTYTEQEARLYGWDAIHGEGAMFIPDLVECGLVRGGGSCPTGLPACRWLQEPRAEEGCQMPNRRSVITRSWPASLPTARLETVRK